MTHEHGEHGPADSGHSEFGCWNVEALKPLIVIAVRQLDPAASEQLFRAAGKHKGARASMQRLRITAVPPMMRKALAGPSGWAMSVALADMLDGDVRRTSDLNTHSSSLRDVRTAASALATRWGHPSVARLWLVSVLGKYNHAPATLAAEGLLRAEGAFHFPPLGNKVSPWGAAVDGPWIADLTDGETGHPAMDEPAERLVEVLAAGENDANRVIEWLTGAPGEDAAPAGEASSDVERSLDVLEPLTGAVIRRQISEPREQSQETAGRDGPGQPGDELQHLEDLHAAALEAAHGLVARIEVRRFDMEDLLAPLRSFETFARELAGGVPGTVDTLDELLDALRPVDPDLVLLSRLAHVTASDPSAEAAAAPLRAAASSAVEAHGAQRDGLLALAHLLDAEGVPAFSALTSLLSDLDETLRPSVLAAAQGLLRLPEEALDPPPESTPAPSQSTDAADLEPQAAAGTTEPEAADATTSRDVAPDVDPAAEPAVEPVAAPGSDLGQVAVDPSVSETPSRSIGDLSAVAPEPTTKPNTGTDAHPDHTSAASAVADTAADTPASMTVAPGPPVEAETDGGPSADAEEDPSLEPEPGAVESLLVNLLEQREVAGAYWVASTFGDQPARAAAFGMMSLARLMRREGGPAGMAFGKASSRLPADLLLDDKAARIVSVAAGLTATFVAPYTAMSFLGTIADRFESQTHLHRIITAATEAARAGVHLGVASACAQEDRGEELDAIRANADELLEIGSERNLGATSATRVWQQWIDPDSGWLGQLLVVVREDGRDEVAEVRRQREQVSTDRPIIARMNDTEAELAGANARQITYHVRDTLLRRVHSHLNVIDDWVDLVERERAASSDRVSYEERTAVELRRTIEESWAPARGELLDTGGDELAAAAAVYTVEHLDDLFERLLKGRTFTGRETDPGAWLARPLLRTDIPIDPTTWRPDRQLSFEDVTQLASAASWSEAFQRRIDRNDLDEAAQIILLVAPDDPNLAEQLSDELGAAVEAAQQRGGVQWAEVRDLLAAAKRQGLLDAESATVFDQRLAELDLSGQSDLPADEQGPGHIRTDVGQVLRDLRRLRADLHEARRRRATQEAEHLRTRIEASPALADHAGDLLARVEDGQLVEAEELMLLLESGKDPANLDTGGLPDWFHPDQLATVTEPQPVDDALIEAAGSRAATDAFDFGTHTEEAAARAAQSLTAFRSILSADALVATDHVRSVLVGLGLNLPPKAVRGELPRGAKHRWFNLDVTSRTAPVHQFGSSARGRFRVLVTPAVATPEQITDLLEQQAAGIATILLHTAPVDLAWRTQLASRLRASSAPSTLPLDAHLVATHAANPTGTWGDACALALPFANANPYMTHGQGLSLPREAFFGRQLELRQLLDPYGPTIVFGGRQLGKTALLRQASRTFNEYDDDAVAVHLTIRSIGVDENADRLWGAIHHELTGAGVRLPDLVQGREKDGAVTGIKKWLRDGPKRRLLVLLDEADRFLAAEQPHYHNVDALKELMDATGRRLKVVFAGLHDVGRFQRDANHPFAHLGSPLGIGGLDPDDALSLLRRPLAALGFVADDDVLLRAVTFANYHPAILQHVGSALVERLTAAASPQRPPTWRVSFDDIDAVYDDQEFSEWAAGLLLRTLELDDRYVVLTYAMALTDREDAAGWPIPRTVPQVLATCGRQDAAALARRDREDEVTGLLDELALLGIVRHRPDGLWELRSRYVARMLGTDDQLMTKLIAFSSSSGEFSYDSSTHRRPLEADRTRISPLVDRDISGLCKPPSSARVVIGTAASGLGQIVDVLREDAVNRGQTEVFTEELGRRAHRRPPHGRDRMHRVVVADMHGHTERQAERAIGQAATWVDDAQVPGTVGTVVLLDAGLLATIRQLIDGEGPAGVEVIPLRRMDTVALGQWTRTADLDSSRGPEVIEATGGWLTLVQQAAARSDTEKIALADAAAAVRTGLDDPASGAAFLAQTGIGLLDHSATQAWKLLIDYGRVPVPDFEHELAMRLADRSAAEPYRPVAQRELRLLDRLGYTRLDGDEIEAEPLLAHLWCKANP